MQREIGDEIHLGATVSPFGNAGGSSTIEEHTLYANMADVCDS